MEADEDLSHMLDAANEVMPCNELQSGASFDTLTNVFIKPVPRRRIRKRKIKSVSEETKDGQDGEKAGEGAEETIRGVSEPNVWARKVCRDRQKMANEYEEACKIYQKLEPKMYEIGRCYDKILNSLKTPLLLKVDRGGTEDDREVQSEEVNEYSIVIEGLNARSATTNTEIISAQSSF